MVVKTQKRGVKARHDILNLLQMREDHYPLNPAPTVREIAEAIGLSTATTHRHIGILVTAGKLERTGTSQRNLRLPQPVETS